MAVPINGKNHSQRAIRKGLSIILSEAVVQRCSVKKVFLKVSQNSPAPESLF